MQPRASASDGVFPTLTFLTQMSFWHCKTTDNRKIVLNNKQINLLDLYILLLHLHLTNLVVSQKHGFIFYLNQSGISSVFFRGGCLC